MKRGIVVLSMAALVFGAFALGRAGAQEGTDPAQIQKAWEALAAPGPEHAKLLKGVGTWNCECKCWQQAGGEPTISKGKAVCTEALGGRFIREDFECEMMGKPFHGIGYHGFNKATGTYELAWLDSMGTGIMLMTGTETELKGSFAGPGGMEMKMRSVVKPVSDDQFVMEMYGDQGTGEEVKCLEITYTRAK